MNFTFVVLSLLSFFCLALSNRLLDCPPLPSHKPQNASDLSPSDIKVLIALGDSITAGFGMLGRSGLLDEFRGQSGFIGADEGAVTLFNFFKNYSPKIYGGSVSYHLAELPGEGYYPQDICNAAQSGATASDLQYELQHIQNQLEKEGVTKEWKVINLLIGANDACKLCFSFSKPSVTEAGQIFRNYLEGALTYAHSYFPNTFFNILPLFPVSQVYNISLGSTYCKGVHILLPVECFCAFDTNQANRNYLDDVITEYHSQIIDLVDEWKQKNRDPNFLVAYQPGSFGVKIPSLAYLSDLDCFHPSLIAHQAFGIFTWNSLVAPPNQKPAFNPKAQPTCPTADTRLS